jgi:hypothetical protein
VYGWVEFNALALCPSFGASRNASFRALHRGNVSIRQLGAGVEDGFGGRRAVASREVGRVDGNGHAPVVHLSSHLAHPAGNHTAFGGGDVVGSTLTACGAPTELPSDRRYSEGDEFIVSSRRDQLLWVDDSATRWGSSTCR